MRRQEELPWWSVKILPSTAGGVWVCFLVGELSSHLPYGQKKKRHKTSSVVTNTKGPKMVHTKKKKKRKRKKPGEMKDDPGFSELLAFFFKMCNLDINYSYRTSSNRSVLLCQHSGIRTICPHDYDSDDALLRHRSVPGKRCSAVFETEICWQIL